MDRSKYKKYFRILELDVNCSLEELNESYHQLITIHGKDSLPLRPLKDEMSDQRSLRIQQELKEAYRILRDLLAGEQSPDAKREYQAIDGAFLKKRREQLGLEISTISGVTKIPKNTLVNIEKNDYPNLPPLAYLGWQLRTLALQLQLDPRRVTDEYLRGYRAWREEQD